MGPEEVVDQPIPLLDGTWTDPQGSNADSGAEGVITPNAIPDSNVPRGVVASEVISQSLDTQSRAIKGSYKFEQMGAIQVGNPLTSGGSGVAISPTGILGANAGTTTFSIDTNGNATFVGTIGAGTVIAGSVLANYIQVTGAAADVNAGVTTISGGKITALSITASQIAGGTITASKIATGTITANEIAAGTITADRLSSSYIQVSGAASDVNNNTTTISGGKITASSITADRLSVSTLSAITANLGTVTAGTINATVSINAGAVNTGTMNASRINGGTLSGVDVSAGYGNFSNYLQLGASASHANNLWIEGSFHAAISGKLTLLNNLDGGGKSLDNCGTLWQNGHSLNLASDKTAIVPTSDGYRALYCVESPEVWFMDFCQGFKKFSFHKTWKFWKWGFDWIAKPDNMFLEVTIAPYVFMPTLSKGIVQVWGKRKGHEGKRFEKKTEEEFKKNEEFLQMAKVVK